MTPIELAERMERAGPDDQRELFVEAWNAVQFRHVLPAWDIYHGKSVALAEGSEQRWGAYRKMLDAKAYLSAAEMLVPDGLVFSAMTDFDLPGKARVWGSVLPGQVLDRGWSAEASTPALALAAACLRAVADLPPVPEEDK